MTSHGNLIYKDKGKRVLIGGFFIFSAVLGAGALAACDMGGNGSSPTSSTTSATSVSGGVPRSGEVIFARYCNTCHPGGGRGAGPSLIIASPGQSDDHIKQVIRNGRGRMPGFPPDFITDPELDSLVSYIRTLR